MPRPRSGTARRFVVWKVYECPRCYHRRVALARRGTPCSMCVRPPTAKPRMNVVEWLE